MADNLITSPTVMAAAISGAAGVVGTLISAWVGGFLRRRESEPGAIAAGLTAQLDGWRSFAQEMQEVQSALRIELREVHAQVDKLSRENGTLIYQNKQCEANLALLQERIAKLERGNG